MPLDRDIHHLLFQHDCVIVPGFGGFLTHYRPARLDEQRHLVQPPSKDLSFNKHLVRQDGLLVDQLVRREGLDFQQAKTRIEEEVTEWSEKLQRQGRLEVLQVGTFFLDHEQNLQFEPDRRVNFLKDAYGLRPVAAVPIVRPDILPKAAAVPLAEPEADTEESRRTPAFLAAAATIAILLTAATWWVVGTSGPKGIAWSGFDLLRSNEPARYVLPGAPLAQTAAPVEASIWSAPADMHGIHEMPIAGPDVATVVVDFGQAPAKAEPESTAVDTPAVQSRYHIIGGCFLEKENADRFISELQAKGFAASLVDRKGGLYRVAYGSYPLKSTAVEALEAVRKEEAPDAWMLVK
ncbi:MAG: SPOR domain-containing protein [Flavobacteriales bacterium]|nr:SPOR domain-containing protein [Flavobacteriales bacterium]